MPNKPAKSSGNPYKVLYWMGAALVILALGIVAIIKVMPKPQPYAAPDPERTLLWMYDAANSGAAANLAILEESRSRSTLTAVAFPGPEEARKSFAADKSSRKVRDLLEAKLQRKLHHRVFLPYNVVATLVDAAGGISVEGKSLKGAEAVAYIRDGGEESARRAADVMLALSGAVTDRGVNMGLSEGLSLARQVDTDLDLTALPDVLARWTGYPNPSVRTAPGDLAAIAKFLLPDPVEPATKP